MNTQKAAPIKTILYCEGNIDGTIGGSFFSLLYLVKGLDKSKYKPIVVFHSDHSLMSEYREAGIETIVIPRPTPTVLGFNGKSKLRSLNHILKVVQKAINFTKFLPLTVTRYIKLIREKKVDLLHLNNSVAANHDWMIAALLSNIKCVTHDRAIYSHYSKLTKTLTPRLDKVICISKAVQSNLLNCGVPSNNIVIYNGIAPHNVKAKIPALQIREEYGIHDNTTVIGVVGNVKDWKGQKSLVLALPKIIQNAGNIVCMFIGDTSKNDMDYRRELDEIILENHLRNHVIFTGYKKNVFDYLNALDIMIHTSIEPEPFGRVLIEGMAMKKPVVGARAGAVPEIVIHNETGLTFAPLDYNDLSNSVLHLLKNPKIATAMGQAGYERLHECFLVSENTKKTEEVYNSLLT
jgi:glycosyltransferase involved in cell wall biosynthesis